MVNIKSVWQWYSRESVQKALIEVAKNREVASVFQDGSFGKRPDIIQYPQDILQSVAEGTISFHGSVEQWSNPMELNVGMSKPEIDKIRTGWSLLIDPDVKDFEIAKIVTKEMMDALRKHGIKNYSVKFTGGKGFHIGVPFESFPDRVNLKPTSDMYPSLPQTIIEYLKSYTRESLKEKLLNFDDVENLAKRIGKNLGDIITENEFDPFKVVSMDIFGMRHLFRLPFSLHESTLLVSLPIRPDRLDQFQKEDATVDKAKVDEKFLIPSENKDGEALVVESLDWGSRNKVNVKEELPVTRKFMKVKEVPETFFPPCIKYILDNGLGDGKKRALFILMTFMRNMGWSDEKIQDRIMEWNEKNMPPLSANYLRAQLRWHFRQDRNLLPPNCVNDVFYKQMGLYDMCCKQIDHKNIKNPVNVPLRRLSSIKQRVK
ncbi:MAG: hypothetical protein HYW22_00270 [Candidatus Aenigmarchaeota archaeon]|nr:hypothetical protein [Candidatus Aenigmarchaeota archaeon]